MDDSPEKVGASPELTGPSIAKRGRGRPPKEAASGSDVGPKNEPSKPKKTPSLSLSRNTRDTRTSLAPPMGCRSQRSRPSRSGDSSASQWFVPEDITAASVRKAAAQAASRGGFSPRRLRSNILSSDEEIVTDSEPELPSEGRGREGRGRKANVMVAAGGNWRKRILEIVTDSESEVPSEGEGGRGRKAGVMVAGGNWRKRILLSSADESTGRSSDSDLGGPGRPKKRGVASLGQSEGKKRGVASLGQSGGKKRGVVDSTDQTEVGGGDKNSERRGVSDTVNQTANGGDDMDIAHRDRVDDNMGVASDTDKGVASDIDMGGAISGGESDSQPEKHPPPVRSGRGSGQDASESTESEIGDDTHPRRGRGRPKGSKKSTQGKTDTESVYSFRDDSEPEESIAKLVQTPGGKKYRRLEPIRPTNPTPGMRRSKRARIPPAKPWENQQAEYDTRRQSGKLSIV